MCDRRAYESARPRSGWIRWHSRNLSLEVATLAPLRDERNRKVKGDPASLERIGGATLGADRSLVGRRLGAGEHRSVPDHFALEAVDQSPGLRDGTTSRHSDARRVPLDRAVLARRTRRAWLLRRGGSRLEGIRRPRGRRSVRLATADPRRWPGRLVLGEFLRRRRAGDAIRKHAQGRRQD